MSIDSKEIKNAAKTAWGPDASFPKHFNEAAEEIEKARDKVLNIWVGTSFEASEIMYLGIQHALTESGGNGPEDRGEFQRFESMSEELNAFVDDIEYAISDFIADLLTYAGIVVGLVGLVIATLGTGIILAIIGLLITLASAIYNVILRTEEYLGKISGLDGKSDSHMGSEEPNYGKKWKKKSNKGVEGDPSWGEDYRSISIEPDKLRTYAKKISSASRKVDTGFRFVDVTSEGQNFVNSAEIPRLAFSSWEQYVAAALSMDSDATTSLSETYDGIVESTYTRVVNLAKYTSAMGDAVDQTAAALEDEDFKNSESIDDTIDG